MAVFREVSLGFERDFFISSSPVLHACMYHNLYHELSLLSQDLCALSSFRSMADNPTLNVRIGDCLPHYTML